MRVLAAVPLLAGGIVLGTATGAGAQSENASCAAVFVHGPPGPPGQFQREVHDPEFGRFVAFVARADAQGLGCYAACGCPTPTSSASAVEP